MKDNWAFLHLCKHFIKALPFFKHYIDCDCEYDVKYICSPASFKKGEKANNKTILHIDSNRWYEVFIEDNNK